MESEEAAGNCSHDAPTSKSSSSERLLSSSYSPVSDDILCDLELEPPPPKKGRTKTKRVPNAVACIPPSPSSRCLAMDRKTLDQMNIPLPSIRRKRLAVVEPELAAHASLREERSGNRNAGQIVEMKRGPSKRTEIEGRDLRRCRSGRSMELVEDEGDGNEQVLNSQAGVSHISLWCCTRGSGVIAASRKACKCSFRYYEKMLYMCNFRLRFGV